MSDRDRDLPLAVRGPSEAAPLGEALYAVIDRAFRRPPHPGVEPRGEFRETWERHLSRSDFLLLTTGDAAHGGLVGFLYGYRGRPGTWWFDRVTAALDGETRERWLSDAFEIVSVAVAPEFGGRGHGTALLRKALNIAPTSTAVLSTYRDRNPAVRWYLREGFRVLHPGLALSSGSPPMLVMGRHTTGEPRYRLPH